MVYRKHTQKSRTYKRNGHSHSDNNVLNNEAAVTRPVLALPEHTQHEESRSSKPSSLLNSIFGPKSGSEKSLFKLMDYDICLDDLLLIGLIVLLISDKMHDEILLVVLVYLLLDIF
jgi:hypothetical protein